MSARSGTTLLELLVTIVVMAIIAGVAVLAIRPPAAPDGDNPRTIIEAARRRALESGLVVDTSVTIDGVIRAVTALPDGRVIADSVVGVDRLTAAFVDSGS